jgi:hypothetical protein
MRGNKKTHRDAVGFDELVQIQSRSFVEIIENSIGHLVEFPIDIISA